MKPQKQTRQDPIEKEREWNESQKPKEFLSGIHYTPQNQSQEITAEGKLSGYKQALQAEADWLGKIKKDMEQDINKFGDKFADLFDRGYTQAFKDLLKNRIEQRLTQIKEEE